MKTTLCLVAVLSLFASAATLPGCSTGEPGVKNTFGNLSTTVNAAPPATTSAAEQVLKDLDLLRVSATSTELDGEAFGYTAADKKISVSVKAAGDNVSRIWVRVGALGDEDLGLTVVKKIEAALGTPEGE